MSEKNLRKKIQEVQEIFASEKTPKTGKVIYEKNGKKVHKYDYFTLSDIFRVILPAQKRLDFTTYTTIDKDLAKLVIIDDSETMEITIPVPSLPQARGGDGSSMQDSGGISTYARRYLLLQAFNIVEEDIIENGELQRKADEERASKEKEQKEAKEIASKCRSIGESKGYTTQDLKEMGEFVEEERGSKPYYQRLLTKVEMLPKKIEGGKMFEEPPTAGELE